jgi:hypothetical protein
MPAPFDLRASNPDEPLDEANLSGAIVYLDNRRVVAA